MLTLWWPDIKRARRVVGVQGPKAPQTNLIFLHISIMDCIATHCKAHMPHKALVNLVNKYSP